MISASRFLRCSVHSTYHTIEDGRVAVVRLTRDRARNALSTQMCDTILKCTADVSTPSSNVRAVIITGTETSFCAGKDLKASLTHSPDQAKEYYAKTFGAVKALLRTPIPVIASIEKICLGLGLELALAADLRVCGQSTQLGFPEIGLSLFPGCGGAVMLPALLGNVSIASDWILTGRRVSATEARSVGVVNRVTEDGAAFNECLAIARQLMEKNRDLLIKTKRVVKHDFNSKVESDWMAVAEQLRLQVAQHPDHLAALDKFSKYPTAHSRYGTRSLMKA